MKDKPKQGVEEPDVSPDQEENIEQVWQDIDKNGWSGNGGGDDVSEALADAIDPSEDGAEEKASLIAGILLHAQGDNGGEQKVGKDKPANPTPKSFYSKEEQ